MIARGLGSLFPSVPSTGNVGPAGIKTDGTYGTVGDAIRASQRNESPVDMGRDNNTYIPLLYIIICHRYPIYTVPKPKPSPHHCLVSCAVSRLPVLMLILPLPLYPLSVVYP